MDKRSATLTCLVCLAAASACVETPTMPTPGTPRFDGGWVGPGGRSATDSSSVNADTATCSRERGGGWVGPGGRVEDSCETTSLGQ